MKGKSKGMGKGVAGFTLLELMIVMGMLAGFMVFLTQLLSTGVGLFDEGEAGQELSDLANVAAQSAVESVGAMVGPERDRYEPGPPDARMVIEWVPLGLPMTKDGACHVQALRATVGVTAQRESELVRAARAVEVAALPGLRGEDEIAQRLDELVAQAPKSGRAELVLMPWPAPGGDGAFLELREALLLPGQLIPIDKRSTTTLWEMPSLAALPAAQYEAMSRAIAAGLLHFELAAWSQTTRSFDGPVGPNGPALVWDSARAGLFLAATDPERTFALDIGPESLENTTDDVFPRAVRITLVVARRGREARLSTELAEGERSLAVDNIDLLPGLDGTSYVKVGAEWVRYGSVVGDTVTGLVRGARGTAARRHPRGTAVRVGKTIHLLVELAHHREHWND